MLDIGSMVLYSEKGSTRLNTKYGGKGVDIMPNIELLKEKISDSGLTVKAISEKSGIDRVTFYNRLKGIGEFTASEIVGLSDTLRLSKAERDEIFLKRGST